jgi:hypothetical protein
VRTVLQRNGVGLIDTVAGCRRFSPPLHKRRFRASRVDAWRHIATPGQASTPRLGWCWNGAGALPMTTASEISSTRAPFPCACETPSRSPFPVCVWADGHRPRALTCRHALSRALSCRIADLAEASTLAVPVGSAAR